MIILPPTCQMSWAEAEVTAGEALGLPATHIKVGRRLVEVNMEVWRRQFTYLLADFCVKVDCCGKFWAPPGYGPLRRVNIDGQPTPIRHQHFEFHLNGGGHRQWRTLPESDAMTPRQVAQSAVMLPTWAAGGFAVSAMSLGTENAGATMVVSGTDTNGEPVRNVARVWVGCGVNRVAENKTIDGMSIPLALGDTVPTDADGSRVLWGNVTRVGKTPTQGAITLFAHRDGEPPWVLAEMGPSDENSVYTQYEATPAARGRTIHGLFRPNPPQSKTAHVWVGEEGVLKQLVRALNLRDSSDEANIATAERLIDNAMSRWENTVSVAFPDAVSSQVEFDPQHSFLERDIL